MAIRSRTSLDAQLFVKQALLRGHESTAVAMQMQMVADVLEGAWAPWKRFEAHDLMLMRRLCPEGQFFIFAEDGITPLAALNTQRITWNGDTATLPTWDQMIGKGRFARAYDPNGNTLVMLNITVNEDVQGRNLPSRLIEKAVASAEEHGIGRIIVLFRPKGYGLYRMENGLSNHDIAEYLNMRRDDGLPEDAWQRNLERNGMQLIGISRSTFRLTVPMDVFEHYKKTYRAKMLPERYKDKGWLEVSPGVWECGECGTWYTGAEGNKALYNESRGIGLVWERK